MANTNFANLKKKALQKVHAYDANDSARLELAGGLINDALASIQADVKGSIYEHSLDNTIACTASQAYVDLTDTDIIEIFNVYQRDTDTKLRRLDREEFVRMVPDTTRYSGVPEFAYFPTQILSGAGVNTWRLYLINTPSGTQTVRYDYLQKLMFSEDGSGADAEFCKIPSVYDAWIYAEFKPLYIEVIDPANTARYTVAQAEAEKARKRFRLMMTSHTDRVIQIERMSPRLRTFDVADTPSP